ncbi:hypothetical protein QQ045_020699 [Rhodiola kirilowii]
MAKYFTLLPACILFFFTRLGPYSNSATTDHCSTPLCNPNDYDAAFFRIHFPFRLPHLKSNPSCGYNDHFTLSCGQKNETLLHLPKSGAFRIKIIDYYYQNLFITDPNNCFYQRIFDGFDLSDSPFSTASTSRPNIYTYYNCTDPISPNLYHYNIASCMSGDNYTVIVSSGGPYNLTNCTVIKTVPAPGMPYGYEQNMLVQLYWYEPDCRTCMSEGGVCGFKEHPRTVGCRISKNHGLSDGVKYALILGISIPTFFISVIFILRRGCRSDSETAQVQQPPGETQLVQNQAATVLMGLDGPTIESYPKYVLSQNDALLKPNTGPCSICLCEYKAQDMLRSIPDCNHYFHSDCVDEWLKLNATCPVCRKIPHVS